MGQPVLLHWDGEGPSPYGREARRIEAKIEAEAKRTGKLPIAYGVRADGDGYAAWVIWDRRAKTEQL